MCSNKNCCCCVKRPAVTLYSNSHFLYSLISLKSILWECFMLARYSWPLCLPHWQFSAEVNEVHLSTFEPPVSCLLQLLSLSASLSFFMLYFSLPYSISNLNSLQLAPCLCLLLSFVHLAVFLFSLSLFSKHSLHVLSLDYIHYSSLSLSLPLYLPPTLPWHHT